MDETRRLAYLEAMGIDVYQRPVPAPANPTARLARPVARDTGSERYGGPRPGSLSARPGGSADTGIAGPVAPAALDDPRLGGWSGDELRFRLQFYPLSGEFLIINEIPHQAGERNGDSARALLQAILQALQVAPEALPAPLEFSWPMPGDDDASVVRLADARDALGGFFAARLPAYSAGGAVNRVLVFAGPCSDLFAPGGQLRALVAGDRAEVVIAPSLGSMLQVPALKRDAWQRMRHWRAVGGAVAGQARG